MGAWAAAPLPRRALALAALLALVLAALAVVQLAPDRARLFLALSVFALVVGLVYLAWQFGPVWSFTAGLVLSPFTGNWDELGIPIVLAPDRLLLATGVVAVFWRTRTSQHLERSPKLRITGVHYLLLAVLAYAFISAFAAGTLGNRDSLFVLIERLGVIPFLVFLCAAAVFRTQRDRDLLLAGLVGLGAYLGVTALLETLGGPTFPAYINDETVGILPDRARGPFVEPATNGLALFACAAACAVAYARWTSGRVRAAVCVVGALCAAGVLFTVTRQVWVAAVVASLVTMIAIPALRRFLVPAALAGAFTVFLLLATVPGLAGKVEERRKQQNTVWDRLNLNQAALNAIEKYPLVGVGWQNFRHQTEEYLELNPDYPLTRVGRTNVHNVFLAYGSELGLVGVTLWMLALVIALGTVLVRRGPPELLPWRALLLAVFVFYVVIGNFEFPQVFSNLIVWLLAGVVAGGLEARKLERA